MLGRLRAAWRSFVDYQSEERRAFGAEEYRQKIAICYSGALARLDDGRAHKVMWFVANHRGFAKDESQVAALLEAISPLEISAQADILKHVFKIMPSESDEFFALLKSRPVQRWCIAHSQTLATLPF